MKRTVLPDGVDYQGTALRPHYTLLIALVASVVVGAVAGFAFDVSTGLPGAFCVFLGLSISSFGHQAALLSIRHHSLIVNGVSIPLAEVSDVQVRGGGLEIRVGNKSHRFPLYSHALYTDVVEAVAATQFNQERAVDRTGELARMRKLRFER